VNKSAEIDYRRGRHDKFVHFIALMMKLSGMSVRVEPRNMVNPFVPHALLRDPTQGQLVQRVLQGAIPDQVYTDPADGREKMVEFKVINQCPSRYSRQVATSLRAWQCEHACQ